MVGTLPTDLLSQEMVQRNVILLPTYMYVPSLTPCTSNGLEHPSMW